MERLGEEVARALGRSEGGRAQAYGEITAAWPEAVGDEIARQAWPLRVGRDGTLHVATSSSTWAFELDRLAPQIQERLRAAMGESAPPRLRFRPGPIPEPPAPSPARDAVRPEVAATLEETAEATAAASAIQDPELRELVARAARASLVRARDDRRI